MDEFKKMSNEKEVSVFLNEIVTVLHDINTTYSVSLVEDGVLTKERVSARDTATDNFLKQVVENIRENIKFATLSKKAKEIEVLKAERDNLKSKVERAQQIIDETKKEMEKSKKATVNDIKRKLQIGRDRIIAIAETSNSLGKQINKSGELPQMIDTLNNIRESIEILTNELLDVGLWDSDEMRPNTLPIIVEVPIETPKKKPAARKSAKKNVDDNPAPMK